MNPKNWNQVSDSNGRCGSFLGEHYLCGRTRLHDINRRGLYPSEGSVWSWRKLRDSLERSKRTIWSAYQGDYAVKIDYENGVVADSPATEACAKIGGTLPTIQQYENLSTYFEHSLSGFPAYHSLNDQGRKDLYALFPDIPGHRVFWSSSVSLGPSGYSNEVYGIYSTTLDVEYLTYYYNGQYAAWSVQCTAE